MIGQVDSDYIRTRPFKLFSRLLSYGFFEGRPLTTKGQWINPLVMGLFKFEKRLPPSKRVEKPIFVIGTGRSGTTILGVVLSMHRQVGFLNEPKALWHSAFPSEDLIGSYSRDSARYRLGAGDATPDVKRAMHRLFGWYLLCSFSQRVVDKYPELIFRVPFVRSIFPDAKFLFLVRNGWDTCHSIDGWSKRLGENKSGENHDWWGRNNRKWNLLVEQIAADNSDFNDFDTLKSLSRHTDMAAVEWVLTMQEGLRLCQERPDFVKMVRYESLVENSDVELSKICEFCDLPKDDVFLDYAKRTLSTVEAKPPFELHDIVHEPFVNMMKELGY